MICTWSYGFVGQCHSTFRSKYCFFPLSWDILHYPAIATVLKNSLFSKLNASSWLISGLRQLLCFVVFVLCFCALSIAVTSVAGVTSDTGCYVYALLVIVLFHFKPFQRYTQYFNAVFALFNRSTWTWKIDSVNWRIAKNSCLKEDSQLTPLRPQSQAHLAQRLHPLLCQRLQFLAQEIALLEMINRFRRLFVLTFECTYQTINTQL